MNRKYLVLAAVLLVLGIILWLRSEVPYAEQSFAGKFSMEMECKAELTEAIRETNKRLQYAIALNDRRAIAKFSPMAHQLARIRDRMENPFIRGKYDPTIERGEIRSIRAAVARGR